MSVGDFAQLITSLAAVGALILSWRNSRKIDGQAVKIEAVHAATNGMSHELNALTAKASKAEGVKEEKARNNAYKD